VRVLITDKKRYMMKKLRVIILPAVILSALVFLTFNLTAEQKGPCGPPPEIQACNDKSAGDKCSFKAIDGTTKTDVCKSVKTPKGEELSCGDMPKPPKGKK